MVIHTTLKSLGLKESSILEAFTTWMQDDAKRDADERIATQLRCHKILPLVFQKKQP